MSTEAAGRLRVRQRVCNACMSCQVYCSLDKEGVCAPVLSRVRVRLDPFEAHHRITLCRQCKDAACAEACPERAIVLSDDGSYWAIDYSLCTGCRDCVGACRAGAIAHDAINGRVIKCDLCRGNPLCAQVCPTGALTWVPAQAGAETDSPSDGVSTLDGRVQGR